MSIPLNTLSLLTKPWQPTAIAYPCNSLPLVAPPWPAFISGGLGNPHHSRTPKSWFRQHHTSYHQGNEDVLGEKAFVNCSMDLGSIAKFLENKTFLLTGATGYIAKILLEKILRIQPNVKKAYLLIRATNVKAAQVRQQNEVLGKDLFNVLREKLSPNFESFISEKIIPIAGDISYVNFGLADDEQLKEMHRDIDVVINVAATTVFHERYDMAFHTNTIGPKNVIEFAKNCAKIQLLIHVSTAYVAGEKVGLIPEKPYIMGETLNGAAGLNIDDEMKLIERTLNVFESKELPEKEIKQKMKNLGIERAKLYGWPNTYVFTKAMGEMLVGQLRGDLPVIIMRPTIVCSTLKEPFSGWIDEDCRTIDSLVVSYGKGRLSFLPFDKTTVFDLIPADMLVNSIIVAMKAHVNQPTLSVYQVGSSFRNPITTGEFFEVIFFYFTKKPWSNKEYNTPVNVRKMILLNTQTLKMVYFLWNFMGHMILNLASRMGSGNFRQILLSFSKKLKITMIFNDLYKPYMFFKGIFLDTNTRRLLIAARDNGLDEDVFNFDSQCIDWKEFFINVHCPSVVKYLM